MIMTVVVAASFIEHLLDARHYVLQCLPIKARSSPTGRHDAHPTEEQAEDQRESAGLRSPVAALGPEAGLQTQLCADYALSLTPPPPARGWSPGSHPPAALRASLGPRRHSPGGTQEQEVARWGVATWGRPPFPGFCLDTLLRYPGY